MSTTTSVETDIQSILVKLSGLASFVAGAVTAAMSALPHYESIVLSVAGAAVVVVERYWDQLKKEF